MGANHTKEVRKTMAEVTLQSLVDAAEAKYGTYVITVSPEEKISFLHPVSLSEEGRKALIELGTKGKDAAAAEDAAEGEEPAEKETQEQQIERLTQILQIVVETPKQYERLVELLSPRGYIDLGLLGEVVNGYMKDQKVGEASASQG